MMTYTQLTGPSRMSNAAKHTCPLCNGNLERTWRRPVDRFASKFVPVHRFQCQAFSCRWEGNFRSGVDPSQANANAPIDTWTAIRPTVFAMEGLAVVAVAALVMAFPVSEWFSGPGQERAISEQGTAFDYAKQMAGSRLQAPAARPVPAIRSVSVPPLN